MRLELYCVRDVMSSPVDTVLEIEKVQHLAELLLCTSHGGFPVVRKTASGHHVFVGLITRCVCVVLVRSPDVCVLCW